MLDWWHGVTGTTEDEESDPVSKALRTLGQGASDIGTGISSAASSAGEALGSGLSSAASTVGSYLPAPFDPATLSPEDRATEEEVERRRGIVRSGVTAAPAAAITAGAEAYQDPLTSTMPAVPRAGRIISEAGSAAGEPFVRGIGTAIGGTEPAFTTPEIETPLGTIPSFSPTPGDIGSAVGRVAGDPTSWVLPGTRADKAADLAIRNLAGPVARAAAAPVRAAGRAVGNVVGEAAEGLGAALGRNAENVAAADARMAAEGGTSLPGTLGVITDNPLEAGRAVGGRIIPPEVADTLDYPLRVPDDPALIRAIEAQGGTVDERGTTMHLIRNQGPEAAGGTATRGMTYHIAGEPGARNPYASTGTSSTGGSVRIEGWTRYRNPLAISEGDGKGYLDNALEQLGVQAPPDPANVARWEQGVETLRAAVADARQSGDRYAIQANEDDLRVAENMLAKVQQSKPVAGRREIDEQVNALRRRTRPDTPERTAGLEEITARYGGDPSVLPDLVKLRPDETESGYAIIENIIGAHARRAGHDGVLYVRQGIADAADVSAHPSVAAADTALQQANAAENAAIASADRLRDAGKRRGHPEYDAAWQRYEHATQRTREALRKLDDAERQARAELAPRHIEEVADPREARNPTPGAPRGERSQHMQAQDDLEARIKELDTEAQRVEAEALRRLPPGANSEEWLAEQPEVLAVWRQLAQADIDRKRLGDELFRLRNQPVETGPPGYTLREDIPRRAAPTADEGAGTLGTLGSAGGGGRRWVPDARYQSGGFWHTPAARVPDDVRAAQREVILRNADHLGAVRAREEIEASLKRAPDDEDLRSALMDAVTAEERAKETVDAAREWQQMVQTGDKTLATSGTLPATRGAGALSAVNRALGEGVAGGVGGAVIEQGRNPDEDPRTAAARGFAVGAVGFPAATRLARGAARLAGAGDGAVGTRLAATLGSTPDPQQVVQAARQAASVPMTGAHTNGQHVTRNVARQIQKQAAAGVPPQAPNGPMPPPNPPPSWWDHVENWRYNLGLFAQLSTGMVQAAGGVVQALGGGAAEAVRLGVLKGQGEALPLIAAEGLKSLPGAVASSLRTAAGQVPKAIEAGSDYKPSLHAREFAQGNVGRGAAALAVGTPGRVMTQAPDALWYDFFYKTGLGQAAADVVNAEMGGAPLRGIAGGAAGAVGGYASTPEDASPKERTARTLGGALAGGSVASLGPNSLARASRMRELIEHPTPEMIAEATKLAQNATYKGEPGPWFGAPKAIGKAVVEKIPSEKAQGFFGGLGSFFMPIYNTIARIHEQALEYTPGVGMLPLEQVGLAPKGQARPISRRLAQQAVGGSLVLGGLAYAAEGGIRGPGPSNPNEAQGMRDQGYTPNTTNVAGYWVPNSWFGPWGPILNEIGAVNDARIYDHGDKQWSDLSLEKQAYAILKMSARAARDYPALDTAQTITKLFTNPEDAFPSFLGEVAAQFVPGPVRTIATAEDTKARTRTRGKDVPFGQRVEETFRQRSGIGREQLPVAQDLLGREVANPRQGWGRALAPNIREEKPDPVIQAYLDAGLNIGDPATELTIPSLKDTDLKPQLTPDETRRWDALRGEALIKRVEPVIAAEDWQQRPPESRQKVLETKRTEAAEEAHGRLRSEIGAQEINRRISEARAAKQRKAS